MHKESDQNHESLQGATKRLKEQLAILKTKVKLIGWKLQIEIPYNSTEASWKYFLCLHPEKQISITLK